ncbi:hypothetical protein BDD12DRAFT_204425 [Trichophaea hybrida]|nr:hypothetical protein BDD12DRAFT_204425 [Trichophaea hybrida]
MTPSIFEKSEIKACHADWVKRELVKSNKKFQGKRKVDSVIGYARKLLKKKNEDLESSKTSCPKDIGIVLKPSSRMRPPIIVESVSNHEIDSMRSQYLHREHPRAKPCPKVNNFVKQLFLIHWSLAMDGETVHCKIEWYKFDMNEEHLILYKEINIFPRTEPLEDIIFTQKDIDTEHLEEGKDIKVAELRLSSFWRKAKKAVQNEGRHYAGEETDNYIPQPTPVPKPPNTMDEFRTVMHNMVQILGLDKLYNEDSLRVFATKAARNIGATLKDLGLPESATIPLTRINLYDTIFYCDDSGSMRGQRYKIQQETVARLIPIATRLSENEVSLRFINHGEDFRYDKLNADEINQKLSQVHPFGGTQIGTVLDRKIIDPLLRKLRNLERPLLITIITDGEPYGERRNVLKDAILKCKRALEAEGRIPNEKLGHSAVIFQIHYVGEDAEDYIDELDNEIGNLIFCNKKPLDIVLAESDPTRRNEQLLEITNSAIEGVLSGRTA